MPALRNCIIVLLSKGVPCRGNIGLGIFFVSGYKRFPFPPAITIAEFKGWFLFSIYSERRASFTTSPWGFNIGIWRIFFVFIISKILVLEIFWFSVMGVGGPICFFFKRRPIFWLRFMPFKIARLISPSVMVVKKRFRSSIINAMPRAPFLIMDITSFKEVSNEA